MCKGLQLFLCLTATVLATACVQRNEVTIVADNDPKMLAAISKARASLPQFWQVHEKRSAGETDFCLKVKVTDSRGTEHFWAMNIERQNGKIVGTINNDPNLVAAVKLGDRIEISEDDVTDWLTCARVRWWVTTR
jgi:uncharacterized protein YegJ (DUF2314 family)